MACKHIRLNCDLGEELYDERTADTPTDTIDARVMPYIDMANIACGGHAGDHQSMSKTVHLAVSHKVSMGAHPSYPDRENFGRKSLDISSEQLAGSLHQQISSLASVCLEHGTALNYIKPHGALYHDCIHKTLILECLVKLAQEFSLPIMLLSLPENHPRFYAINQCTEHYGVALLRESFADRSYTDNGELLSRSQPNAVHNDLDTILNQAKTLIDKKGVFSKNNTWLSLSSDSLCVHGDTPLAFHALKSIRRFLDH